MAGNARRLRVRPEFEQRLARFNPDEQEQILNLVEQIAAEPISAEDVDFAYSGEVIHIRSVGDGIFVQFRILADESISVLTCGRWPTSYAPRM